MTPTRRTLGKRVGEDDEASKKKDLEKTYMVCRVLRVCIVLVCTLRYMWDIIHHGCFGSLSPAIINDNLRDKGDGTNLEFPLCKRHGL